MEPQELDEELTIDLKKIFKTLWSRKKEIFLTFVLITGFFIALTFILPKKYTVTSDLYINKTGTTNLSDLNPFVIADQGVGSGFAGVFSGGNSGLNDELEIIQSPLVIDRVIKENDLKIKKGKKAGEYISTAAFLKKNISIEKQANIYQQQHSSKKIFPSKTKKEQTSSQSLTKIKTRKLHITL